MPPDVLAVSLVIQKGQSNSDEWHTFMKSKDMLIRHVLNNGYWTRAWIVQEVALARQVTVWIDSVSIDLKTLEQWLDTYSLWDADFEIHPLFSIARSWRKHTEKNGNLVHLLDHLRDKQYSDPRDRVFSFLSLTNGYDRNLEVDYYVSRVELAADVLHRSETSLCLCTAILVAQVLERQNADPLDHGHEPPCLELPVVLPHGCAHPYGKRTRFDCKAVCESESLSNLFLQLRFLGVDGLLTYWDDIGPPTGHLPGTLGYQSFPLIPRRQIPLVMIALCVFHSLSLRH